MIVHQEPHPQAGQTVWVLAAGLSAVPLQYRLEDWWDRINGQTWGEANGNIAAMNYAMRAGSVGLPFNDEVVYGKIDHLGYLVHITELRETEEEA